jgi:hypothetical protein
VLDAEAELQPVAARQVVVEQDEVRTIAVDGRPQALLVAGRLAGEHDPRLGVEHDA